MITKLRTKCIAEIKIQLPVWRTLRVIDAIITCTEADYHLPLETAFRFRNHARLVRVVTCLKA